MYYFIMIKKIQLFLIYLIPIALIAGTNFDFLNISGRTISIGFIDVLILTIVLLSMKIIFTLYSTCLGIWILLQRMQI